MRRGLRAPAPGRQRQFAVQFPANVGIRQVSTPSSPIDLSIADAEVSQTDTDRGKCVRIFGSWVGRAIYHDVEASCRLGPGLGSLAAELTGLAPRWSSGSSLRSDRVDRDRAGVASRSLTALYYVIGTNRMSRRYSAPQSPQSAAARVRIMTGKLATVELA